ncbi:UNKNOWN [Stylonychia lemnae]|uniref:Uncharacterized protein n=1 Tax=Stylonychia lemnae TaxID=5949 RepID=A0A077ZQA9_STYLE|nr:UNKNOWN [Stylonychia lemnae]|eukprot:CDW71644.1 UNKNOWN [Stylonychia lemnae]
MSHISFTQPSNVSDLYQYSVDTNLDVPDNPHVSIVLKDILILSSTNSLTKEPQQQMNIGQWLQENILQTVQQRQIRHFKKVPIGGPFQIARLRLRPLKIGCDQEHAGQFTSGKQVEGEIRLCKLRCKNIRKDTSDEKYCLHPQQSARGESTQQDIKEEANKRIIGQGQSCIEQQSRDSSIPTKRDQLQIDDKFKQHKLQNLGYGTVSYNTVLTTPSKPSNWDKFIQKRIVSLEDSALKDKTAEELSKELTKRKLCRMLGNKSPSVQNSLTLSPSNAASRRMTRNNSKSSLDHSMDKDSKSTYELKSRDGYDIQDDDQSMEMGLLNQDFRQLSSSLSKQEINRSRENKSTSFHRLRTLKQIVKKIPQHVQHNEIDVFNHYNPHHHQHQHSQPNHKSLTKHPHSHNEIIRVGGGGLIATNKKPSKISYEVSVSNSGLASSYNQNLGVAYQNPRDSNNTSQNRDRELKIIQDEYFEEIDQFQKFSRKNSNSLAVLREIEQFRQNFEIEEEEEPVETNKNRLIRAKKKQGVKDFRNSGLSYSAIAQRTIKIRIPPQQDQQLKKLNKDIKYYHPQKKVHIPGQLSTMDLQLSTLESKQSNKSNTSSKQSKGKGINSKVYQ